MNDTEAKIKDLDADDRPQERAWKYGCDTLSTADLWALVLRVGQPGKPITVLCRELMATVENSMLQLQRRSRQQIMEIKGLGKTRAIQIEAVMTLVARYHDEWLQQKNNRLQVRTARDIY